MGKQTTILAVDDDEDVLNLYRLHAEDQGYKTIVSNSAMEALEILTQAKVDLIISDVLMPELDGYEFCRRVKENPVTESIPFVFVSAMTELEELVIGYSLGADDYVTKPIEYDQFIVKIKHILDVTQKNEEVKEQLDNYYKTAMQAMNYSSEMGVVIEFYKVCISAKSFRELANYIFMSMKTLELRCSFQVYDLDGVAIGFAEQGTLPPLEIEIMQLAKNQSRFYDFGIRTIINDKNFSLLIKNMPRDDEEKHGRLKDILATLCDAISARIEVLLTNDSLQQKQKVIQSVGSTIKEVDASFSSLQKQNIAAIENMMGELEESLLVLGLTEYQEENIITIAKNCLANSNKAFQDGVEIKANLEDLRDQLSAILH